MKIYYNNEILNIETPLYISGFTLKTLIYDKLGLTSTTESILKSNGKIINNNDLIDKTKEYEFILKKLGGNNLVNPENSTPLMVIISLLFGFISISYLNTYKNLNLEFNKDGGENIKDFINKYTKDIPKISKFDCDKNTKNMIWYERWGYYIRRFFHCNEVWLKFCKGIKLFFYYTFGILLKSMGDKQFQKSNCGANMFFTIDTQYYKKTDSSLPNVLTYGIFFVYMYIVFLPMLTNFFTTFYCGSPGYKHFGISFLFFLIPLILGFIVPYLVKLFNIVISYFTDFNLNDYRIAFSNISLLVFGFIFLLITGSSLTTIFYALIAVTFVIFALLKFRFGGIGLSTIFSNVATFLSNLLFLEDDEYNKVPYEDPSNPLQNQGNSKSEPSPECFMRYRVIYDFLESGYTLIFSFVLSMFVFYPQINKNCRIK